MFSKLWDGASSDSDQNQNKPNPSIRRPSLYAPEESYLGSTLDRFPGVAAIKQHASDFNLANLADQVSDMQQRTAISVQTRFPLLGGPFWACLFYSLISTSMILVNKLVLTTYHFKYPMVLLFHQNLMTVNCLYLAGYSGITTYEPLDPFKMLKWLPMDIFFVLMLLTGFYSVQMLSVPMITIFKNTNNIFVAVGDALVFGNIPSTGVIWSMVVMLVAAFMAALNDLEYTSVGYAWTLANCLASTCFVLYAQTAIARTNLSTFGKVYYNNVLALPLVAFADYFFVGDFQKLYNEDKETILNFFTIDFGFIWFLSGILGFLQSLSSLKAQHLVTPTTYSMVGSLNKIPLTLLGVYIFHSPMTAKGVLYVSLSILAGALYSYAKAKEDIESRASRQPEQSIPPHAAVDRDQEEQVHFRNSTKKVKHKSMPTPAVDAEQISSPRANNM